MRTTRRMSTTLVSFVAAVFSGFLGALGAGSISSIPESHYNSLGIAVMPILSAFFYYSIVNLWRASAERGGPNVPYIYKNQTWNDYMYRQMQPVWLRLITGVTVATFLLLPIDVRIALAAGVLFLPIYIFGIALHGFALAVRDTNARIRPGESWVKTFWATGNAQLGASIFGVYIWCFVLLAPNAGFQLAGMNAPS